jgi:predicted porin
MKYRTLALAALAAAGAAHAQSSATLYGVADAGLYDKQLAGEARLKTQMSGGLTTSHWGLRGREDLGDGLFALFDLSSFASFKNGNAGRNPTDPFFSRAAWAGLQGGWGTLRLGRIGTAGMLNLMRYSAFNDSFTFGPSALHVYLPSALQPMMTGSGATDTSWANTLNYLSPDMAGFTASLAVSAGEGTTAGRRAWAGVNYGAGPMAAGVVLERFEKMSLNFSKPPAVLPMSSGDTLNAGASYDFKLVKLFGQYVRTKLNNASTEITLATKQVSASVPVSTGYVLAAFARTDKQQTAAAEQRRETFSLGYDYFLSKRTDLYAVAMNDRVAALRSGTGYALGIRHRF